MADTFVFPSGSYDFVAGHEAGVGPCFSCSLFSPVFEFDSQEAAEATAMAALAAIMDEENFDAESRQCSGEIERIWNGPQATAASGESGKAECPREPLSRRIAEPMSRRAFLRGGVFTEPGDRKR